MNPNCIHVIMLFLSVFNDISMSMYTHVLLEYYIIVTMISTQYYEISFPGLEYWTGVLD